MSITFFSLENGRKDLREGNETDNMVGYGLMLGWENVVQWWGCVMQSVLIFAPMKARGSRKGQSRYFDQRVSKIDGRMGSPSQRGIRRGLLGNSGNQACDDVIGHIHHVSNHVYCTRSCRNNTLLKYTNQT